MAIIITIIGFCLMVLLHELGHFLTAKSFSVPVEEFSIGMGPKLFSFEKGGTQYAFRILPLGGYVKLEGENEESKNAYAFSNIHPFKKIVILCAGAFMNVLLGFVLFVFMNTSIYLGVGTNVISEVSSGSVAESAGILAGDKIIMVDNQTIGDRNDFSKELERVGANSLTVTLIRNGEEKSISITPEFEDNRYIIGVYFKPRRKNFDEVIRDAFNDSLTAGKLVFTSLKGLLSGQYGIDEMSGPVGIVTVVGEVTKDSGNYFWIEILWLFGLISINLGIFNLLPIPALDGGSVIFSFLELLSGKKLNQNILGYINTVGLALLLLLSLFVMTNDIIKLF